METPSPLEAELETYWTPAEYFDTDKMTDGHKFNTGTPPVMSQTPVHDDVPNLGTPILTPTQYTPATASPDADVSSAHPSNPAVFITPSNQTSTSSTPGHGLSLSLRALAAKNRVKYAEQVLSGGGGNSRNTGVSQRPSTPYTVHKGFAIMTPRDMSDDLRTPEGTVTPDTVQPTQAQPQSAPDGRQQQKPPDWLSPEDECQSPGYKPQLAQMRKKREEITLPVVVVTPASLASSYSTRTESTFESPMMDPSPVVSDLVNSSDVPTPYSRAPAPSVVSSLSGMRTPRNIQAELSPVVLDTPNNTPNSDSAVSGLGMRSSVSGSHSHARWRREGMIYPVTPSSYVRPRSPTARSLTSESGIHSCAATTGSGPDSTLGVLQNASHKLPVYSMGIKVIKTVILALANITTALCLSILGPTLPGLMTSHNIDLTSVGLLITSRSAGGVMGVILLHRFFDDVTPFMSMTLALLVSGGLTAAFPFIGNDVGINVASFFTGASLAFLFCASGTVCLHIWSRDYINGMVPTQIMLSVGMAAGPLLCRLFLDDAQIGTSQNSNANVPAVLTTQDALSVNGIVAMPSTYNNNDNNNATGDPSPLLTAWSPQFEFYYVYLIVGVSQVFVGLLFMTLWLRTDEPTFQRRGSFEMVKLGPKLAQMSSGVWEAFYCVCLYVSLTLLSMGLMGIETVYQLLLVTYILDTGVMGVHPALYVLASHHGAYLLGRGMGCADDKLSGSIPVLMLGSLGTVTAFVVQYSIFSVGAIWGVAVGSGFCLGSMLPTLLYHVEQTRPLRRDVAAIVLACTYVSMTAFPVITGTIMTSQGRLGFEMVLLVTSVVCSVLVCAVLTFTGRLRYYLRRTVPTTMLTELGINPTDTMLERTDKTRPQGKKVIDTNGNVVDTNANVVDFPSVLLRFEDGTRVRGAAYHMMNVVSLGARAVVGRW